MTGFGIFAYFGYDLPLEESLRRLAAAGFDTVSLFWGAFDGGPPLHRQPELARRAGLLHDIGKALDHEIEGSHVQIGVDICRKYKENTQIIHAIEAHHGDVEPKTPLAFIIQAADAISAARPGARRENVESYVKRLENLEEISSSFEGVEQAFAVQAGREVRILVKPDVISDDQVILLARAIAKKIEDTLDYPGQIKVNVIRESRAVEYAK